MIDQQPIKPPLFFRESPETEATTRERFAQIDEEHAIAEAQWPLVREAGIAALHRLLPVATGDTGGSGRAARFLLCCYNGGRFPYDLSDFRGLDQALFNDCIAVLRMDRRCEREIHRYIEDGSAVFEVLAKRWGHQPEA